MVIIFWWCFHPVICTFVLAPLLNSDLTSRLLSTPKMCFQELPVKLLLGLTPPACQSLLLLLGDL